MDNGTSRSDSVDQTKFDLQEWVNSFRTDNSGDSLIDFGMDATTINPSCPSYTVQQISQSSTNVSQYETTQGMIAGSFTPSPSSPGQIVQQLLDPVTMNKAVQKPPTHSLTNLPNFRFGNQKNQLQYQLLSNQLLPATQTCNQLHEPIHQFPKGPLVQTSQRVTNLEAMENFNKYFPSRRPLPQPGTPPSRMPGSLNDNFFPTVIDQMSASPLKIGSLKAPQPTASITKDIYSGLKTSSVMGLGSPIGLFSTATSSDCAYSQPHTQPLGVANQMFTTEKHKQVMPQTNELTKSKMPHGRSLLDSKLVSQFDQALSGTSSSRTIETPKPTLLVSPPSQEPDNSKDALHRLTEVVKSISSDALSSFLSDIRSIEKAEDIAPNCISTNLVREYDNKTHPKRKRELSVTSHYNNGLDSHDLDMHSAESSISKRPKIETRLALLDEIRDTNCKLVETKMQVVLNPSAADKINRFGGHEGTIVKCLFRNVCFPDLLGPLEGVTSEKMPEFDILLLVPVDYPASSARFFKSEEEVLSNEPWAKLYEKMLSKFQISAVPEKMCLGDLARKWDASARAVMTEFVQKLGGKSFSSRFGSWET